MKSPLDRALLACQRAYQFNPGAYTWEALQAVQALANNPRALQEANDGWSRDRRPEVTVRQPIKRRV